MKNTNIGVNDTDTEKIRVKVQTLAASKNQLVQVKFRDQAKVKGYIDAAEPVSFKLRDSKDGTSQSIAYAQVESASKAEGASTRTWLIVGGVAVGALATFLIVKPAVCDGGAQSRGPC